MKHKIEMLLFSALALAIFADSLSWALAPNLLTYQGRLQESSAPVTGARSVEIAVCNALIAGTCFSTGVQGVSASNGLFRSTFTLPGTVDLAAGNWYLEVRVGPVGGGVTALSPREQLTSSPYAVHAGTAASISAVNVSGGVLGNNVIASEYYRKPPFRHTRTLVAYNAADATKDSQCVSDFGSSYSAAKITEAASVKVGVLGTGFVGSALGVEFNVRNDSAKSYAISINAGTVGSGIRTVTGGSYALGCISNYAALRFTSTLVAYSSVDGTKDGQCVTEFGSSYMAANILDVALVGGTPVVAMGGPAVSASDISFNVAGNTTHSWAFSRVGETTGADSTRISMESATGGTYRVACIRK